MVAKIWKKEIKEEDEEGKENEFDIDPKSAEEEETHCLFWPKHSQMGRAVLGKLMTLTRKLN